MMLGVTFFCLPMFLEKYFPAPYYINIRGLKESKKKKNQTFFEIFPENVWRYRNKVIPLHRI